MWDLNAKKKELNEEYLKTTAENSELLNVKFAKILDLENEIKQKLVKVNLQDITPLKKKYSDLQAKINNLISSEKSENNNKLIKIIKAEMDVLNDQLEQVDISIDTVLQEIIENCDTKYEDQNPQGIVDSSIKKNDIARNIIQFLKKKIESASPINLIDGKSLLLGIIS